jgi:hypothetical protein
MRCSPATATPRWFAVSPAPLSSPNIAWGFIASSSAAPKAVKARNGYPGVAQTVLMASEEVENATVKLRDEVERFLGTVAA